MNANSVNYFDKFEVENIPVKIKKSISNKKTKANIYKTQGNDSIMCGYFCIRFIDLMLKRKSLLDYTSLFSPNKYEQNDKIILKTFQ